ncbi:hypothetical protein HPP92_014676 [Vanilla planifolia]|uniref:Uncharacterized protein n=1 Tax=Vanilla planifolia TaxID=51239 RepID=A0A835QRF2_VANPL|nr:hypothetical protein HPP92_014676 [Vanilla planifolia]
MANNGGGFAGWDGVRREDEEAEDEEEEENGGRVLEAWERAYADERSWEDLQEDESGLLRSTDAKNIAHAQYRRRLLQRSNLGASRVQKGLIRYLYVVIDLSREPNPTPMYLAQNAASISAWTVTSISMRACTIALVVRPKGRKQDD